MSNIKYLRQKAKITQVELALHLGVTQSAISQWETGEAKPDTNKLPALAKKLNCTIDEMLADPDEKKAEAI